MVDRACLCGSEIGALWVRGIVTENRRRVKQVVIGKMLVEARVPVEARVVVEARVAIRARVSSE